MNTIQIHSFLDELTKIADAKEYVRGIGKNLRGAVSDLSTPIQSAKNEVGRIKTDLGNAISRKSGLGFGQRAGHIANHGLTAALTIPSAYAALKKDPTGQTSRAERVSRFVGSTIGGLATARRGLSGGILGSMVGDQAGKLVGKGVDKLTGFKKKNLPEQAA